MDNFIPMPTRPLSYAQVAGSMPKTLDHATHAFIRRDGHVAPLSPLYEGPYRILARSSKTDTLASGKKSEINSIDRIKPYLGAPVEADPPKRGRPPAAPPATPAAPPTP